MKLHILLSTILILTILGLHVFADSTNPTPETVIQNFKIFVPLSDTDKKRGTRYDGQIPKYFMGEFIQLKLKSLEKELKDQDKTKSEIKIALSEARKATLPLCTVNIRTYDSRLFVRLDEVFRTETRHPTYYVDFNLKPETYEKPDAQISVTYLSPHTLQYEINRSAQSKSIVGRSQLRIEKVSQTQFLFQIENTGKAFFMNLPKEKMMCLIEVEGF